MSLALPIGPLTAVAMADALACGVEFLPRFPKLDLFLGYRQHTMYPYATAGCYSDDTQYQVAMVKYLLAGGKGPFFPLLLDTFTRDPRGGSPRMQEALLTALATRSPAADAEFVKTAGAGAAMRAAPFAFHYDVLATLLEKVQQNALETHDAEGALAAQAAALMTYLMSRGQSRKDELAAHVASELGNSVFLVSEKPKVPGNNGVQCVRAALWAVQQSSTLCELLQNVCDMGGDTDTVAVIAMGAVWMSEQFAHDLPDKLWYGLENGPYGRAYLRQLEMRWMASKHYNGPRLRVR